MMWYRNFKKGLSHCRHCLIFIPATAPANDRTRHPQKRYITMLLRQAQSMHDHVPPSSHIGPTVSQTIWQCATTEDIVALFMTAAAQLNAVGCLFRRFISCCVPRSRLSCYPVCPFLAPPCLFQHQCSTSFTSRPGLQVGTIDQRHWLGI